MNVLGVVDSLNSCFVFFSPYLTISYNKTHSNIICLFGKIACFPVCLYCTNCGQFHFTEKEKGTERYIGLSPALILRVRVGCGFGFQTHHHNSNSRLQPKFLIERVHTLAREDQEKLLLDLSLARVHCLKVSRRTGPPHKLNVLRQTKT